MCRKTIVRTFFNIKTMKRIIRPQLTDAVKLTARELNDMCFSQKHTVLTPEQLEKIAKARLASGGSTSVKDGVAGS